MRRMIVWPLAALALAGVVYGLVMVCFNPAQRTVAVAKFISGGGNIVFATVGVLSEPALPYLHRLGVIRPIQVEVEKGIHMDLDPRDEVPRQILAHGAYEPATWKAIADHLPPGGVFIDIGAHIGSHTLKGAKQVGPQGRVIAVEPNPDTLIQLRRNIQQSGFSQVLVAPVACADREATLELFAASTANTGMTSLSQFTAEVDGKGGRKYQVRARPLDDITAEAGLQRVDAIKIDVEGAELLVLQGAMETIRRFHPFLIVEVKDDQLVAMKASRGELYALMRSFGYSPGRRIEENVEWVYKPDDGQHAAGAGPLEVPHRTPSPGRIPN